MPKYVRALLWLALTTLLIACSPQGGNGTAGSPSTQPQQRQADAPDLARDRESMPYVRAAHWFGSGWPVNHWNTNLEAEAEADFRRLKEDGFNTVVILVPWPGFAPDPRSGELDPQRVQRLRGFIRLADSLGLQTILRVSYAWDSLSSKSGDRLYQLWHDDAVYQGWLDHLAGLWQALGEEPNLLFGFFSWEDLWAVMSVGDAALESRLASARTNGFQSWLRDRQTLAEVSKRYGSNFADWSEVPVPARREPAFALFLQFVDEAWIERFFRPAQARFPRLSMEVRIDSDPVWDGERLVEWHSHESAWNLPGAEWTTLYWSPAMGGMNQGEELSPQEAADRLAWMLRRVLEGSGGRPIFIGQFLAEDYTPGYEHNGRVPKERIGEFLAAAAGPLQELAAGYGLWTWRDYAHDAIANPEFAAGLADWEPSGEVALQGNAMRLAAGAALRSLKSIHEYHAPGGPERARFCIEGEAAGSEPANVVLRDLHADSEIGQLRLPPAPGSRDCLDFAVRDLMRLELTTSTAASLRRISSTGFVQHSGMRELDATPKPIASAYIDLNRRLQRAYRVELPLHGDGWMGRSLSQSLPRPEAGALELRFTTHLPEDWPVRPRLVVSVDGARLAEVECLDGHDVSLPLEKATNGAETLRLRIDSSLVARAPGDERDLGCLLSGLTLAGIEEATEAEHQ
jgi:hypothetical protein